MGLDVKLPIGLLFTILGLLLIVYGLTSDPAIYAKSLGINVNVVWGGMMLVFELAMFYFSDKRLRS